MKEILKNASEYLPFINEKDGSGLTASERIIKELNTFTRETAKKEFMTLIPNPKILKHNISSLMILVLE